MPNTPDHAWMHAIESFLLDEPAVEAIRLDPQSKTVEMATLGRVDGELLQAKLAEVLRTIDAKWLKQVPEHTSMLEVSQKSGVVQIEKPSCPTAPTFWKWREFEWPEADEIEQESDDEWRTLAMQAAICGVSLVPGRFFGHPAFSIVPLIAGGRDAAKDVAQNHSEGRLSVYLLQPAVSLVSRSLGAGG